MKHVAALVLVSLMTVVTSAPVAAASPGIALESVATQFKKPLQVLAHHGANRLYVVEQRGTVQVMRRSSAGAPWQKAGIFLDIRDRILGPLVGRGLLGMAFHPNYANNDRFYVFYTRRPDGHIAIVEYRRSTNFRARPGSARVVLVIPHPSQYHFGGWLGFGPDGYMYVTTGDAAAWSPHPSQDMHSRLGKILRLNPRASNGSSGQIPADNPFADGQDGDPLVWAAGLRNPWRASFDRLTGDLWVPDVGQDSFEEVNVLRGPAPAPVANFGWRQCEGMHAYPIADPVQPCSLAGSTLPLLEYPHADGDCSVIGGHVYRGTAQPSLAGRYFFADYCTGHIWSIPTSYSGGPLDAPLDAPVHITSFGTDATGELYVTAPGGTVWRVVASD